MNHKRKRAHDLIPKLTMQSLKRLADAVLFAIMVTSVASLVATVVVTLLNPVSIRTPYRFCLATETEDSCVHRPGRSFGKKTYRTPDKLLDYFGSIPERVQQKWRVWVMDSVQSQTTEMTVAEFYAWVDSVWIPLQADAGKR